MAIDYGMPDSGFTVGGGSMGQMSQGMPDAAMLGNILGDLTAKITVWEERIPGDYAGVPKKTKTVEEIDLAELMGGPAPMSGAAPMMMDPNNSARCEFLGRENTRRTLPDGMGIVMRRVRQMLHGKTEGFPDRCRILYGFGVSLTG